MLRCVLRAVAFVLACGLSLPPMTGRAQGLGDRLNRRLVKELAAGKFLIASRGLADPNFSRTVVLLVGYTAEGAAGFIVNRPGNLTLGRLFPRFAESPAGAATAFLGGPVVSPGALAALARSGGVDGQRVLDGVYLVRSRDRLESAIADGDGSSRLRVYVGYAGWGPGQLDDETAGGSWRIVEGEAGVVFDAKPESVWARLIARTEALSASAPPQPGCGATTLSAARWTRTSSGP